MSKDVIYKCEGCGPTVPCILKIVDGSVDPEPTVCPLKGRTDPETGSARKSWKWVKLTEGEEGECDDDRYDCPIHGLQDGPDCPRC